MVAVIRYADAQTALVVVLSVGRYTMRILTPGGHDTTELSLNCGQWTDEAGAPVTFEALLTTGPEEVNRVLADWLSACSAGVA